MAQQALTQKAKTQMAVRTVAAPLALIILLFGLAGRWDYWQAWVFVVLNAIIVVVMATRLTPDSGLTEERLNPKQGMKSWDRAYFALSTPLYFIGIGVAGLDARFHWTTSMPTAIYAGALVVYIIGQAIMQWARYTNRFFSSVVRIQTDRGQTVCKSGPYHYVRHPGYAGGMLFEVVTGLVLGSWWACIPQLMAALLLIWRTGMEDKTLQAELPGYSDYAQETRYRLLPGIW